MGTEGKRELNWEPGTDTYALLCVRQLTSENPVCSAGDSTQRSVVTCMGRESKHKGM